MWTLCLLKVLDWMYLSRWSTFVTSSTCVLLRLIIMCSEAMFIGALLSFIVCVGQFTFFGFVCSQEVEEYSKVDQVSKLIKEEAVALHSIHTWLPETILLVQSKHYIFLYHVWMRLPQFKSRNVGLERPWRQTNTPNETSYNKK